MKLTKYCTLALVGALLHTNAMIAQESQAENIVTQWYAYSDAGNTGALGALMTDDFSAMLPVSPAPFDKNGMIGVSQGFKTAFPDMHHDIVYWFAKGNRVAVNGIFKGTNSGPLMGNPATGNRVTLRFSMLFELDGMGKIKSIDVHFDNKSFETQLMAGLPAPQDAGKQAVLNIMEKLNKHDLEAVLAGYASDTRFHGWAPQTLDNSGYKQVMSELLAAFPDARFVVDDVVAEGNKVVVRHHLEGTHTGAAFQGVPASNRKVAASATVTFDMKGGKVTEAWLNADFLGLLSQIGAIPAGK